tara:strand:- start:6635 stop:6808 length:174 start_codon:yes stop_codon:yes gene_type:complete
MNSQKVYIALSQFCQGDDQPRKVLVHAGFDVHEKPLGGEYGVKRCLVCCLMLMLFLL